MRQVIRLSVVLLLAGAMISTASAATDEERAKQLERERTKLEKETDPVDRAKIGIRISEMLLEDVGDSVRDGNVDEMERELTAYTTTIQAADQALADSRRDAAKKASGFKEFEIALRKHLRKFDDFARMLNLEQRGPLEKTRDVAKDIRDKLLKALFP
jgi:hypothetical protein